MKLSPKQNQVIYAMQQGWELFCSNESKWVICGSKQGQFVFHSSIFYRLVRSGLIRQSNDWPFDYHLTKDGREAKTRKLDLTPTL